jgi:hypothetical protein
MAKNNMYFVSASSSLKFFNFNVTDNSVNLITHSAHHQGNINIITLARTSLYLLSHYMLKNF